MNSLQNKAVSALQIFVSKYSLLLFVMLLGVDNAKAQQSSQNRIIGYWKGDLQTVYNGINITAITYDADFADGSSKAVVVVVANGKKITETGTGKYWFEGKYLCSQSTGKIEISKSTLDWISDNEGYQTGMNGAMKGLKGHFVRVNKEEFEYYFNNSGLIHVPPFPTSPPCTNCPNPGNRGCWTCLQSGKVNCSVCHGAGRTTKTVQTMQYNYDSKRYEPHYEEVSSECSAYGCTYGKVPCTNPSCPYK